MTVDEVRTFVSRERQAAIEDGHLSSLLADDALVDRGEAITGLIVAGNSNGMLTLTCDKNESRFRSGSRLEFRLGPARWSGVLVDLMKSGCLLRVRAERPPSAGLKGPWVAVERSFDLSVLIRQCLKKLQPGAPGWSFFQAFAGGAIKSYQKKIENPGMLVEGVVRDGCLELGEAQCGVVGKCLELPFLFGCQGPPGTGKSQTLAVVAECLSRAGKRIVVLAPTHQAVNNALSVIHRTFPNRPVVKVGDELRRESLDDDIQCQLLSDAIKSVPPKLTSELITGMTFASALHHLALRSSGLGPNVLLIDEAGQVPLSQGLLAGLVGAGSVLLFGDDAQMPPVFPSDVAHNPLAISLFSGLRRSHPDAITMLDTTYRLNAELCEVIGTHFYPESVSKLKPSTGAASQRLQLNVASDARPSIRVALCDSPSLVWMQTPNSHCKQVNVAEVEYVAELVATAMWSGLSHDAVAVVTPFRRQAAAVRRRLQAILGENAQLPIVDTVERVQGLTVDLIVISGTTSDPEFAGGVASFLFSPNRLNVAISRARRKAVLVISPSALDAVPSEYDGFLAMKRYEHVAHRAKSVAFEKADVSP